jgi:hypothetical protein
MAVTNVEKFLLKYNYRGREITVNGERFDIDGKTQIWIPVLDNKGFIKHTHVLWENVKPGMRFFRYPLPKPKESRMLAIIEALDKQLEPVSLGQNSTEL